MGLTDRVLLDSVILIDHFNGVELATGYLEAHAAEAFVSAITRAEVLTGFAEPDEPVARTLLDRLPMLSIDRPVADLAARLRRDVGWKLPDAFQAAVAIHHSLIFVTRNERDFPPGRFPWVAVPYRL